ncbi:MAG: hypothetical protein WC676_01300 [Candidatus Omnitrophota bacterium]
MPEYRCPHCKNPIYDEEALLCHFCGESLGRSGDGFLGKIRYSNKKVVWFFLALITLIIITVFVLRF